MRDLMEEHRLARDVEQRFLAEHRLWHARKGGEFIDHPAQIADLTHDCFGQPSEGAVVIEDLLAIAALKTLSGELNRGQRVLDLVRDAARDVGPGRTALVEQLLGNVVEGQHLPPSSSRA